MIYLAPEHFLVFPCAASQGHHSFLLLLINTESVFPFPLSGKREVLRLEIESQDNDSREK